MPEALKDQYFSPDLVQQFAELMRTHAVDFDDEAFTKACLENWPELELKARMSRIAQQIIAHSGMTKHAELLKLVVELAPSVRSLQGMVLPEVVQQLGTDNWEHSVDVLRDITQYSSSEFAIRPFIKAQPERALALMLEWTQSPNEHVRRLASEGCRPRLPWAESLPMLKRDPQPILPIIDALCDDTSDYVRRSAANNLNDIAKDNPEVAAQVAKQWFAKGATWATRHGMRTLLKSGSAEILTLFGYKEVEPEDVSVDVFPKQIARGETVQVQLKFTLPTSQLTRIDMGMHFVRKNGSNEKRFKLVDRSIEAGIVEISKSFSFKPLSTRQYYPGQHKVEIYVNGRSIGETTFEVL